MSLTRQQILDDSCPAKESVTVLHTRVVTGKGGGPEKTILNSPRFLEGTPYHALCAYMHPPGDSGFVVLRRRAEAAGASLLSIPDRGAFDTAVVKQLAFACRENDVKIWHGHDYKSNALGLLIRRRWPMHLVTTVHGWVKFTWKTPVYYAVDRYCLKHYDRVVCVSEDLHDRCLAAGVPPERCTLIDNAIDTVAYRRRMTRVEARQMLELPAEGQLIGAVGRLSAEKGFDLLIQAVGRLVETGRNVHLAIAGDGEEHERLADLAGKMGIAERVHLLGFCEDPLALYQALDLFALSSLREGLPNVLLEAMALEVPVVTTRVAGVPRLITDGHDGLIVEIGNVKMLAKAIARVLDAPELQAQLMANARETIETRFSFAHRMERMQVIYDSLDVDVSPGAPS